MIGKAKATPIGHTVTHRTAAPGAKSAVYYCLGLNYFRSQARPTALALKADIETVK